MSTISAQPQAVLPHSKTPARKLAPIPIGTSTLIGVLCALSAAWIAAGSVGLLGHELRHVLTWIFIGAGVVALWPRRGPALVRAAAVAASCALAVFMTPAILPVVNIASVLVVLAVLAFFMPEEERPLVETAVLAIAVFAIFRMALQAIPTLWIVSDRVGHFLGFLAGGITGQKLSVGTTFGGIDFLVLSGVFVGLWIARRPAGRLRLAAGAAAALLIAQFAYLSILSFAPVMLKDVPIASKEHPNPNWVVPVPGFLDASLKLDSAAFRQFVPNNLLIFAGLFDLAAIVIVLRWGARRARVDAAGTANEARAAAKPVLLPPRRSGRLYLALAMAAALVLPLAATYCTPAPNLEGKKIVISDRLYGNFLKPQNGDYGHLSIGMYGDLQPFIQSLGGKAVISATLSDEDLKDADALVLIYPNKSFVDERINRALVLCDRYLGWSASGLFEQIEIDRIWKYVENGGTILVMGEHTTYDEALPRSTRNYVNEILAPTGIRVNFDSATFEIGGWLQSYQALAHPITEGIEDSRNQFGVVIGASLDVKFPARPVLVGRWGWADPGDEGNGASMMGNHHYDPGERLGDLVLIAEQSYGKGRVVAFGDPSNVTNGITIGAHPFNGRLYSYLTHNPANGKSSQGGTPQAGWRQILGFMLAGALVVLLAKMRNPLGIGATVLVLSLSMWGWSDKVAAMAQVLPDGRKLLPSEIYQDKDKTQPNYHGLAYIDNSHLGFYSEESWRPTGTMGLSMNLMRNGYLTFMAPDLKQERLAGASLLVIPAPTRPLSKREIADLHHWVDEGGQLIMTVGWDRYRTNRDLLASFKFYEEKIPISAIPPEVVDAVRRERPGDEILQVAAEQRDGFGYYVFDVKRGNDKFELLVHPKAGLETMDHVVLSEKRHTAETWQAALTRRGDLPPAPMGFFKVPYIDFGSYRCFVRFHSGWPVRCSDPMAAVVATNGSSGVDLPLIMWRSEGKGRVYLFGDSEFATNQNLENEGGQKFEGMRENADFWRWFISYYLENGKENGKWWRPPNPAPPGAKKDPADNFDLEGN